MVATMKMMGMMPTMAGMMVKQIRLMDQETKSGAEGKRSWGARPHRERICQGPKAHMAGDGDGDDEDEGDDDIILITNVAITLRMVMTVMIL